jgi:hypothetical protein
VQQDAEHHQWLPWLKQQREAGLQVLPSVAQQAFRIATNM